MLGTCDIIYIFKNADKSFTGQWHNGSQSGPKPRPVTLQAADTAKTSLNVISKFL